MDHERFDRAVRALANPVNRRTGLLAALALAAGAGEAVARKRSGDAGGGSDAEHGDGGEPARRADARTRDGVKDEAGAERRGHRRRRRCKPACGPGFTCERGRCECASGIICGDACCAAGQSCVGGACVTPTPEPVCLELGVACAGAGPCCDGLTCGSGQGGGRAICCQADDPRICESTSECCYGRECRSGQCVDTSNPRPRYLTCPQRSQGVGGLCVIGASCCDGGGCCPAASPVCCPVSKGGGCCETDMPVCCRGVDGGQAFCCPAGYACSDTQRITCTATRSFTPLPGHETIPGRTRPGNRRQERKQERRQQRRRERQLVRRDGGQVK